MIKGLLYIAILTTTVIISWVIFSVYDNSVTSTISSDTSIAITPIPPNFDTDTLNMLKSKNIVSVDLEKNRPASSQSADISPTVVPTQAITPTKTVSTSSGTINNSAL